MQVRGKEEQRNQSIAFCITCKGRTQHIEKTLAKNIKDNEDYPNARFILLDYNSQDHLIPYLKENHWRDIRSGRLVVYSFPDAGTFRMAHAKNMAHRLGILEGGEILVNFDADNFGAPGFARWISNKFNNTQFLWSNAKSVVGRARQGLAGRIALSKNLFLKIGGYDERYNDWAPEDEDFKARIRRLGYEGEEIEERFLYVIPHKDGLRFKEYPHAKPTVEQEVIARKKVVDSLDTISNFGKFGMGTVYRNFGVTPITLGEVPTRIFGIGMPKTATTSLFTALETLGFDSAHWGWPGRAKKIWLEMRDQNRSHTLEQFYALCDLPITILYKQLDQAYPGSKFILTLRDEESWIKSQRNHFDVSKNPFRESWDNEPAKFSHRIHQEVYGQRNFDESVFRTRYRKHTAEVIAYFKDRPRDLLIMNMHQGAGWFELCSFFGVAFPTVSYPKEFVTGNLP